MIQNSAFDLHIFTEHSPNELADKLRELVSRVEESYENPVFNYQFSIAPDNMYCCLLSWHDQIEYEEEQDPGE